MTSMLTLLPAFTTMAGLTRPAMRKVSSWPPDGLARATMRTGEPVKVMRFPARSAVAPAGISLPRRLAWAGRTRGPGAFAHSPPMTFPGSREVPIMKPGTVPPRIQPGALAPPIIHR